MSLFVVNYATPSVLESSKAGALLGFAAEGSRPLRFHAKVKTHVLSVRLALQALGELIWRHDEWQSNDDFRLSTLDPIVTVHDDQVFFEAFTSDQSAYGRVSVDRAVFEPLGEVRTGTTNIDFTAWLWAALAELRSSRETTFRIGPEGVEVATAGAGGRFERKVDVPDAWVRGFAQLQGAMALPGTRVQLRPVDLIAAIRFLRYSKAKVSPRALRYEFEPGEDAKMVLEPWEQVISLRGATHTYAERRVIRTWGRRRLSLLEPMLPYADRAEVYLKGRGLPSFYVVRLPGVTFQLGLSGWTSQRWADGGSFELLVGPGAAPELREKALELLARRVTLMVTDVAEALSVDVAAAGRALSALCVEGRCIYDLETRKYRHRELFAKAPPLSVLYPPDVRADEAAAMIDRREVQVASSTPRPTKKTKRLKTPDGPVFREVIHHDWVVLGRAGDQAEVELVLNDEDRLIFGRCGCAYFKTNLLAKGPCAHMVALLQVERPQRRDLPTSAPAAAEALELSGASEPKRARDEEADGEDEDLDGEEEAHENE